MLRPWTGWDPCHDSVGPPPLNRDLSGSRDGFSFQTRSLPETRISGTPAPVKPGSFGVWEPPARRGVWYLCLSRGWRSLVWKYALTREPHDPPPGPGCACLRVLGGHGRGEKADSSHRGIVCVAWRQASLGRHLSLCVTRDHSGGRKPGRAQEWACWQREGIFRALTDSSLLSCRCLYPACTPTPSGLDKRESTLSFC